MKTRKQILLEFPKSKIKKLKPSDLSEFYMERDKIIKKANQIIPKCFFNHKIHEADWLPGGYIGPKL